MKIYNTLSRKVEEFIPWSKDKVGFYTCDQLFIIMLTSAICVITLGMMF